MALEDEPFVFEIQVQTHAVSEIFETYVSATDMDKHGAINPKSFDSTYTRNILV